MSSAARVSEENIVIVDCSSSVSLTEGIQAAECRSVGLSRCRRWCSG